MEWVSLIIEHKFLILIFYISLTITGAWRILETIHTSTTGIDVSKLLRGLFSTWIASIIMCISFTGTATLIKKPLPASAMKKGIIRKVVAPPPDTFFIKDGKKIVWVKTGNKNLRVKPGDSVIFTDKGIKKIAP